jgi:TorA maturation chaperone TorD
VSPVPVSSAPTSAGSSGPPSTPERLSGRWELLRAVGALTVVAPPADAPIRSALGLPAWSRADHTRLFVLELPPYAAIHLGAEGKLGGDGADRVAGLWRALGLTPPAEPDHLAALLALTAELGHGAETCRSDRVRRRLSHARAVVLVEHLWSWLPGYLAAASADPAGAAWAQLTGQAVAAEVARIPTEANRLPAALRDAPAGIDEDSGPDELLDALVAPVRVGFVLTMSDLRQAGDTVGVGVRLGERRYALRAMLDQEPAAVLTWLADHARRFAALHRAQRQPGPASSWWADRAAHSAVVLDRLAADVGIGRP